MKIITAAIVFLFAGLRFADAQTFTNIRKVKFGNFTHQVGKKTLKFRDGIETSACREIGGSFPEGSVWNVVTKNIRYGDLDGDGKDEAFVPLAANYCGGAAVSDETVIVYTLQNGKPVKLPEFKYVDDGCPKNAKDCNFIRSPGVTVSFDAKEKALVVKNYYATEDDATCCPSLSRQTWFKWDGKTFKQIKKSKIEKAPETN